DDDHSLSEEYAGDIISTDALGWRGTVALEPFLNNNAFGMFTGSTLTIPFLQTSENFRGQINEKLGMMPYPYATSASESQYDGIGGPMSPLAGYNLAINPNSNNIDAALEMLRTVMTDEFYLNWFDIAGQLPPKPALLNEDSVTQHELLGQYVDTLSIAAENAIPRPVTPIYFQESSVISREVHNVVAQEKAPEQGMTDLKTQLQDIEESYA
ncbi:sugar ABC transporter substrate-binding protein, partial [Halorubrum sp. Atlit-26R]